MIYRVGPVKAAHS